MAHGKSLELRERDQDLQAQLRDRALQYAGPYTVGRVYAYPKDRRYIGVPNLKGKVVAGVRLEKVPGFMRARQEAL